MQASSAISFSSVSNMEFTFSTVVGSLEVLPGSVACNVSLISSIVMFKGTISTILSNSNLTASRSFIWLDPTLFSSFQSGGNILQNIFNPTRLTPISNCNSTLWNLFSITAVDGSFCKIVDNSVVGIASFCTNDPRYGDSDAIRRPRLPQDCDPGALQLSSGGIAPVACVGCNATSSVGITQQHPNMSPDCLISPVDASTETPKPDLATGMIFSSLSIIDSVSGTVESNFPLGASEISYSISSSSLTEIEFRGNLSNNATFSVSFSLFSLPTNLTFASTTFVVNKSTSKWNISINNWQWGPQISAADKLLRLDLYLYSRDININP